MTMKRITSKRNGRWVVAVNGKHKPIGLNPLGHVFRAIDRVVVGPQKKGNSW